ncbi:unnamed protein product, partial [Notodromas monacha]
LVTLVPGANVLIISPNYNLSTISFELQRKLIKHFDLEISRDNLKDRIIELSNGSTIRMGSLSTVDSCVGRSYDLIIFDEAALGADGEAAFNVALRPTLDKPNSKAIFISTPRGKNNWFSRFFERQIYQLAETQICDYVPSDGDEAIAGCDPGYRDPTAFVVVVYQPSVDKYHVVDEYLKSEATTDKHAVAFQELISRWAVDPIFIDSAAPQFASDLAYLYDIATIKAKKDVLPGIAYVQTLVETNRLVVAPHCTHTLAMLDQYRWDTKETLTTEKPLHDEFSHMADALRYALYTFTL